MKTYDEIKDIIVNKLGIRDLASYELYLKSLKGKKTSVEDVELLSPDNVNNADFWTVVEELFGIDCVANTQFGTLTNDRIQANRRNMSIARMIGTLSIVDEWYFTSAPILEIGPGYGAFKNYVEARTVLSYTGLDVKPKIDGIIQTGPDGLIPDSLKEKKFQIVYSSNVFQHLSAKQRSQYYKDISSMLLPSGVFVFNLMALRSNPPPESIDSEDGKPYMRHYGQFTEVPLHADLFPELDRHFTIMQDGYRHVDSMTNFLCVPKKPLTKEQEPASVISLT